MAETGVVKWFDHKKGYGFIVREGGEKDCFFHASDLKRSGITDEDVDEGDRLNFEVANTPRGIKATNISKITADGSA